MTLLDWILAGCVIAAFFAGWLLRDVIATAPRIHRPATTVRADELVSWDDPRPLAQVAE